MAHVPSQLILPSAHSQNQPKRRRYSQLLPITGSPGGIRVVFQRALDHGGSNTYVYWITAVPNPTPLVTIPPFTGTLIDYEIVLDETTC